MMVLAPSPPLASRLATAQSLVTYLKLA